MAEITQELQSFYQFAENRLRSEGCAQTLDELYADWRARNPAPHELEKDIQAVKASLRDMEAGDPGRPFDDFAAEFCQRKGI